MRLGLDALDALLQPRVELGDEVAAEERDVAAALAQRRERDGHHVEPVEQVLAEGAGGDLLLQVAVGRGDQAHVDADGLDAADPLELALLEHAQQLDLHLVGDLANLVEEERAARGQLEAAGLGADRAGEGAALVAEELGLHQVLGDGGAVDLDEGLVAAARVLVEGARDQLLAGAALAGDEHRGRRVGDALEDGVERRGWAGSRR